MTDSYVEKLINNKFLGIQSVTAFANCIKYYQENKENPDMLEAFKYWDPKKYDEHYSELSEDDKAKIDGPILFFFEDSLYRWYTELYPNVYQTYDEYDIDDEYHLFPTRGVYEELRDAGMLTGSIQNDELYEAIRDTIVERDIDKPVKRLINLYKINENDEPELVRDIPIYPVVFENLTSERNAVSDNFSRAWYEIYFNPNPPTIGELYKGARQWWTGFTQVNICIPTNMGTDDIRERYDEIESEFKSKLIHQGIRIMKCYRGPNITEEDFIWCPVTIEWKAYLDSN